MCVCVHVDVIVCVHVCFSRGVIASGAATGASGCKQAAERRLARIGAVAVIGQSEPAEKHM